MLISNRIKIRAIEEADLSLIAQWRNNPEVYEYFYEYLPVSVRQQRGWWEKQLSDSSELNFVISNLDDTPIGTVSIYHWDRRNRKAEWGRLIIADTKMRSTGIGSEIEALILEYSFEHMNLHKLYCEVLCSNEKVAAMHERFGFVKEGVLREHVFKAGSYADVTVLSMTEDEYKKSKATGPLAEAFRKMREQIPHAVRA